MSIVVFVYALLTVSLIGGVGSAVLSQSPAPIAAASGLIFKDSEKFVAVIGIIAMLSALNAHMVGTSMVMLLFFSNHFKELASVSVIAALLPYIFICLSAYRLFSAKKIRFIAIVGAVTTMAILILYLIV